MLSILRNRSIDCSRYKLNVPPIKLSILRQPIELRKCQLVYYSNSHFLKVTQPVSYSGPRLPRSSPSISRSNLLQTISHSRPNSQVLSNYYYPGQYAFFTTGPKRPPPNIQIISPFEKSGPSLRTSLILLSSTLFGVFLYCSYKVGYHGETVFIPLWISAKQRPPYKSEFDKDTFIEHILEKLHNRLSVDEEVNRLLGVTLEFPRDPIDEDKFEVYVRSSSPGITGIMIEPPPSWRISFTSRPFSSPSSGFDRLLQPFLPGEADSEDANTFPGDRPSFYEAVLDGKIRVRSCPGVIGKGYHHSINEGILQFRATRSLSHANATPRFSNTILMYKDAEGNEITKRLW